MQIFSKCIFPKCIFSKFAPPNCIFPKSIFAKCTRLAYLLRFASFFSPKPRTPVANFGMWLKMDGHEWKLIKVDEMAKDCRKWMRPISPNGDGPWNLNRGSSMTIKTPWKLILWNNLCPPPVVSPNPTVKCKVQVLKSKTTVVMFLALLLTQNLAPVNQTFHQKQWKEAENEHEGPEWLITMELPKSCRSA